MNESSRCPECDAELPASAPEGLCPRCLMKQAMGTAQSPATGPSPTTPWQTSFTPPEPSALAEAFPQLEILEFLGRGGMGAVYKARHIGLDRLVALKILPPEAGSDPAFAERFRREARMMAKLNHPNIVTVFDSGQTKLVDSSGESVPLYYFVMEYIDGINLREAQQAGELTPAEALAIVPQVCDALQYAHDQNIVHRDIKPENVLLDKSGRVKVADFGLSKLLARTPVNLTLTASHQVMGTLHYMAPEQMQRPLEVDHRADIYSLGVVFYELLTGEVPIGRFPLPSEKLHTDTRLDQVVLKAMEREPDRRYQQASHVKTDIESLPRFEARTEQPPQRENVGRSVQPKPAAQVSDADWQDAHRQVQGPAIGLIVAGVVNLSPLLLAVVGIVLSLIFWDVQRAASAPGPIVAMLAPGKAAPVVYVGAPGVWEILIILLMFGLNLPGGVLMILGGIKMRKLETYGLAMAASIFALLPGTLGFLISLPVGIWSLIVLNRPEVKASFGHRRQARNATDRREATATKPLPEDERLRILGMLRGPTIGLFCVALMTSLPIMIAILVLLFRLFAQHETQPFIDEAL